MATATPGKKNKPTTVQLKGLPEPQMIQVRCRNPRWKRFKNERIIQPCNARLADVFDGKGKIVCWGCGHTTIYEVRRG